jgi:adenosylcobinamide-GDP ribazoletransferase
LIAASVSTLSTVWLTGCFHEDGLADVFDSFGGGWGKDQILRIMKDSRIGTYALIGSSLVLQMKIQALAGLDKEIVLRALIAVHCTARWTSLPLIYCVHYIQDEEDAKKGLYNWFAQSQKLLTIPRLILGTLITVCIAVGALGPDLALVLFFTTIVMTISAGYYANYVLGGVVGDYLGATICVTETILYMVMLVDWKGVLETPERWQALVSVAVVAALPIIYSRRVIHYKGSC